MYLYLYLALLGVSPTPPLYNVHPPSSPCYRWQQIISGNFSQILKKEISQKYLYLLIVDLKKPNMIWTCLVSKELVVALFTAY